MKKMVRGHDIHDNWYKPSPYEKDGDTGSEDDKYKCKYKHKYKPSPYEKDGDTGSEDDEAKHGHDHRHEVEVRVAH